MPTFRSHLESTKWPFSLTAQASAFQRSITEQKQHAQTARINTALQCSAQTTAELSFSQRHSHRYCHLAAFQQRNTRIHTHLPQLRVPQRMILSPLLFCRKLTELMTEQRRPPQQRTARVHPTPSALRTHVNLYLKQSQLLLIGLSLLTILTIIARCWHQGVSSVWGQNVLCTTLQRTKHAKAFPRANSTLPFSWYRGTRKKWPLWSVALERDYLTASRTIHANCDNLDAMVGRSICVTLVPLHQICAIIALKNT